MSNAMISRTPGIHRLVERQMRNWELARGQRLGGGQPTQAGVEEFICISRQIGTQGQEVIDSLGVRLGWPVFDREILDAMADDDEVRRQIYESMDQRDLSWWEETLRSLMQSEFVRNDYFKRLSETVLSLARQGNCVFVGRGADLLLPSEFGLRVRLVAPSAARVRQITQEHDLTPTEAEQWLRRIESQRRRFFLGHFGVEVDDPVRFDMTLNLTRLSAAQTVATILAARSIHESTT